MGVAFQNVQFVYYFIFFLNTLISFSISTNVSLVIASLLARNREVALNYVVSKTVNCCRKVQPLFFLVIAQEMPLQLFVSLMLLYTLLPG